MVLGMGAGGLRGSVRRGFARLADARAGCDRCNRVGCI